MRGWWHVMRGRRLVWRASELDYKLGLKVHVPRHHDLHNRAELGERVRPDEEVVGEVDLADAAQLAYSELGVFSSQVYVCQRIS